MSIPAAAYRAWRKRVLAAVEVPVVGATYEVVRHGEVLESGFPSWTMASVACDRMSRGARVPNKPEVRMSCDH